MWIRIPRVIVLGLIAQALLVAGAVLAADKKPDSAGIAFFERKIRPVLVKHCYTCHSVDAKDLKGGLLLDSREGLIKGGDSGPAVVPGKAAESLLLEAIRYDALKMPPQAKLPKAVIADFAKWIGMGAPDPRVGTSRSVGRSVDLGKGRRFWSFRPPKKRQPPAVKDKHWPYSDIDRFVLERLEQLGLRPVANADRATLIRRLYFDLIGLPPTPAEIDEFLRDRTPGAVEKVVDRLLNSPHFGERWGRHWLDVARFAESSGGGRTRIFHDAWRYRDYVIRSFNDDKPFDRFASEQIAGDMFLGQTPDKRAQQLTATGFLVLGPTNYELQDKELLRMEVVDEQIETMGRAFLGMTIGCARCHDHKFDPIPTTDYYALAGIFRSTKTLTPGNVSGFVQRPLPVSPQHAAALERHRELIRQIESRLKPVQTELAKLKGTSAARSSSIDPVSLPGSVLDGKKEAAQQRAARSATIKQLRARVKTLQAELKALKKNAPPSPPMVMSVQDEAEPEDYRICIRGNVHQLGDEVPRGFLSVLSGSKPVAINPKQSGRVELAGWLSSPENPLTARVFVNRVWHHLFGAGIVRSTDNFGTTGQPPSHPELLDWLAIRFIEQGWSPKSIVRMIVLSRVYRLDSRPHPEAMKIDPENRWLASRKRRRLDAEAIRDSILSVSGRLDQTQGGPSIPTTTTTEFGYKFSSLRRSVYVPVLRNTLHELFDVFDFADPNLVVGRRNTSTLPTQALYLMNSPFVMDESRHAAELLLAVTDLDDAGRIEFAFRRALGRPPQPAEEKLAREYLGEQNRNRENEPAAQQRQIEAWANFYQALFSCIDFRYVD